MYFVMTADTNFTVCTTYHKEIAEWVAANYEKDNGKRCIIRWAGNGS